MTSRGECSLDVFRDGVSHVQRLNGRGVQHATRGVEEGDIRLRDAGCRRMEHVIDERREAQLDEERHETSVEVGEHGEPEGERAEHPQRR